MRARAVVGAVISLIALTFILPVTAFATTPSPQWATQFATVGASLWPDAVASFPDGKSVMLFEHWAGSLSPGDGVIGGTTVNAATAIVKVDATGSPVWVAQPTTTTPHGRDVAAGPDGTSVTVGLITGTAAFGSTTVTPAESHDIFVAKLAADGTWLWAVSAGGAGNDDATAVEELPDGSVLVAGKFTNSATFGSTTLTSAGVNVFVAKLSASGTWLWALDGGAGASVLGMDATDDGAAVLTGVYGGTTTFGATSFTSLGFNDIFAAKVTANGAWNWAATVGSSGNDGYDHSAAVALNDDGSVFVGGAFAGTMTAGSLPPVSRVGADDLFVGKLSALGVWQWVTAAGGTGTDRITYVAALADGSAAVLGFFGNTSLTLGSTSMTRAAGNTGSDAVLARITAGGTWDWALPIAASGSMGISPAGLAVRSNGSLLVGGVFSTNAPAQTIALGSTTITSVGTGSDANGFLTCVADQSSECEGIAVAPGSSSSSGSSGSSDASSTPATSASSSTSTSTTAATTTSLKLTVTSSRTRTRAGQTVDVQLRLRNVGTATATEPKTCLAIPAGFTVVRPVGNYANGQVCFTSKRLKQRKSLTYSVILRATASGTRAVPLAGTTSGANTQRVHATAATHLVPIGKTDQSAEPPTG
jgi:hypothetical protein